MNFFEIIFDYFLHLDTNLHSLVTASPFLSYLALFAVVYLETALIITTFLPSDAVVFAACSLAVVQGSFSLPLLFVIFFVAAVLGDSTNFSIGRALRKKVAKSKKVFFINKENINKTNKIFEKSGGTAVICSRFIPLLRGLAPFVTGISKREYRWFVKRNILGIAIWDTLYCTLGTFFGNIGFVKQHFGLVAIGITALTLITACISFLIKKYILERKGKK